MTDANGTPTGTNGNAATGSDSTDATNAQGQDTTDQNANPPAKP
ncbi:MAG: hypothetical protein ACJ8GK_02535 [Luteimonas sp.]